MDLKHSRDKRILLDFDVKQDLHILSIKDAVTEDEGSYILVVTNELGSVSVTVIVTAETTQTICIEDTQKDEVLTFTSFQQEDLVRLRETEEPKEPDACEPRIEVAPEPVSFEEGDTIMLSCKASGQEGCRAWLDQHGCCS